MSNARRYAGVGPPQIASSDMPEWIRRMSDHYVKTGTVRSSDAARLRGEASTSVQLIAPTGGALPRNDDGIPDAE